MRRDNEGLELLLRDAGDGAGINHGIHESTEEGSSRSAGMGEMGEKAGFLEEGLLQLSSEGWEGVGQVRRGSGHSR